MEPLSDDSIMREMAHMSQVIARRSRQAGGATGASFVLAVLASHEEAMVEGFAPRLLSQVELADIVGIRPQSLGALLARLEADGCIRARRRRAGPPRKAGQAHRPRPRPGTGGARPPARVRTRYAGGAGRCGEAAAGGHRVEAQRRARLAPPLQAVPASNAARRAGRLGARWKSYGRICPGGRYARAPAVSESGAFSGSMGGMSQLSPGRCGSMASSSPAACKRSK